MMKRFAGYIGGICLILFVFSSCMEYGPLEEENFHVLSKGNLFILNEGNFTYGDATLSYYIPKEKRVENEIFVRANGIPLGDVAQSMEIRNGLGYVVVNNSSVIFVIDLETFKVKGSITNLVSPRYIHFLSDTKAYVTDLYAARITIFNPQTFEVTGWIETPGHESTEQMVQYGQYVFINCWSYDNKILVIDTETDTWVDEIEVGSQPNSLVLDKYNKIWVVTDGGYAGSPYSNDASSLCRIDPETRQVEQTFSFGESDYASEIVLNGTRDTLYFINDDIWCMDVTATRFPYSPLIKSRGTKFYGLGVDPLTSELYVADAIDYQQPGIIYRYTPDASPVDSFKVGKIPGAFCFH